MHADQPQFCRTYGRTARLCVREQLLVSTEDITRRFPSSLGIQYQLGCSVRGLKTILIPVRSASPPGERTVSRNPHLTT